MAKIRFTLAIAVALGFTLAGLRHIRVVPSLLTRDGAARESVLRREFVWGLRAVTLSGGFTRWVLGRRRCNGVYLAPNGSLVQPVERSDKTAFVTDIRAAVRRLDGLGVRFLHVQMPNKESLDGRGFPPAFGASFSRAICDDIRRGLSPSVKTVDLRPVVSATAEDVRDNFLKTDHHWNFEGAFRAFRFLVPALLAELGETASGPLPQLERTNWTRCDIPRAGARFLGSRGRRTGPWFVGCDRLHYLVPDFPTQLRVAVTDRHGVRRQIAGDFVRTLVDETPLAEPATWNVDDAYNVYLGDQARVTVENAQAPVRRSLFIVKDSFSQPLLAWLSTVFTRVVAVDPRHDRGTFVDDVRREQPDLVLIAVASSRPEYWRVDPTRFPFNQL